MMGQNVNCQTSHCSTGPENEGAGPISIPQGPRMRPVGWRTSEPLVRQVPSRQRAHLEKISLIGFNATVFALIGRKKYVQRQKEWFFSGQSKKCELVSSAEISLLPGFGEVSA